MLPFDTFFTTGATSDYKSQIHSVNAVLPGNTLTDRQVHLANVRSKALGITPEEAMSKAEAAIPMNRSKSVGPTENNVVLNRVG